MKPWSHLPSAHLIDWVLGSVRTNTDSWNAVCNATWALGKAQEEAWHAVWDIAQDASLAAAYDAALDAARNAAWYAALDAARNAAWTTIVALIAYDDCQQYLDMTYDQLLTYALLTEKPQAVLLLPLKWVQENETMVTSS